MFLQNDSAQKPSGSDGKMIDRLCARCIAVATFTNMA